MRAPCPSCPWRVDQHSHSIPGFSLELAERLRNTTETGLGAPQMACHGSKEGKDVVCVGWLWRYGWDSIAVRLALMDGKLMPEDLEPDPDIELHADFDEFIAKLRSDEA